MKKLLVKISYFIEVKSLFRRNQWDISAVFSKDFMKLKKKIHYSKGIDLLELFKSRILIDINLRTRNLFNNDKSGRRERPSLETV